MVAEARDDCGLGAALGIVRGVTGALVTVEILTGQGGSVTVDAQALAHGSSTHLVIVCSLSSSRPM